MRRPLSALVALALCTPLSACGFLGIGGDADIQIYSARHYDLEKAFEQWEEKTGKSVEFIFAEDAELLQRLKTEGADSPADIFMTVDAGNLWAAAEEGILESVDSPMLDEAVPEAYRDSENRWFGLALRARTVVYNPDAVDPSEFDAANTYAGLADPKWKGKLCTRSGQHVYNTSLLATVIAHKGEAAAEAWIKGVKDNMARKPAGGDREQARDVQAGLCDLAIGNTYYMAAMLKDPAQKAWADSVKMLFPDAATARGTHVNISGMALAKNAPNKAAALKLMAFLASDEAQKLYAEANNEYPISPNVPASALVMSWGKLVPDKLPIENIAKYRKQASELMDKVKFDAGPGT